MRTVRYGTGTVYRYYATVQVHSGCQYVRFLPATQAVSGCSDTWRAEAQRSAQASHSESESPPHRDLTGTGNRQWLTRSGFGSLSLSLSATGSLSHTGRVTVVRVKLGFLQLELEVPSPSRA